MTIIIPPAPGNFPIYGLISVNKFTINRAVTFMVYCRWG